MRRLAIVFAILAVVNGVEQIVLAEAAGGFVQAPRRLRQTLMNLAAWRAFLIGPLRLFQRPGN